MPRKPAVKPKAAAKPQPATKPASPKKPAAKKAAPAAKSAPSRRKAVVADPIPTTEFANTSAGVETSTESTKKRKLESGTEDPHPTLAATANETTKKRKVESDSEDPKPTPPIAQYVRATTSFYGARHPAKRAPRQMTNPTPHYHTDAAHIDPLALLRGGLRKVLEDRFDVEHIHISNNTNIGAKARAIFELLQPERRSKGMGMNRPILVALTSEARCANKEVSVAEIAKRELVEVGMKVWQYTGLASRVLVKKEKKVKVEWDGDHEPVNGEGDEEEDAFEMMQEPEKGSAPKVRAVPVLTIWLATCDIRELEVEYGVHASFAGVE